MVPLAAEIVQGFLVTIGKNGTNITIGRFTDFSIGRTPNVARLRFKGLTHIVKELHVYIHIPFECRDTTKNH